MTSCKPSEICMRRCQPSPPSVPSFTLPQLCQGTGRGQPPGTPALLGKLGPPFPRAVTLWQEQELGARGKLPVREGENLIGVVEGLTESSVLHCPPSGGAQHRIHFSSAISTHLLVMGKVLNRTGKAVNSLKHKQVLFIVVQALSLSTGTLGFGTGFCARS